MKSIFLLIIWTLIFPANIFAKPSDIKRKVSSFGIEDKLKDQISESTEMLEKLNLILEKENNKKVSLSDYLSSDQGRVKVKFKDEIMTNVEIQMTQPKVEDTYITFSVAAYHIEKDLRIHVQKFKIDLEGDSLEQRVAFDQARLHFLKKVVDSFGVNEEKKKEIMTETSNGLHALALLVVLMASVKVVDAKFFAKKQNLRKLVAKRRKIYLALLSVILASVAVILYKRLSDDSELINSTF